MKRALFDLIIDCKNKLVLVYYGNRLLAEFEHYQDALNYIDGYAID